jgi:thiol:disulfide interchange protein DsbA
VKRALGIVLALAVLLAASASRAQPAAGIDYRELERAQPAARGRTEVIEFFWYRCPHCYEFEPLLERWAAKLPPGVLLTRVPVVFDAEWAIDARIFYALRAMGEEERLRASLYDAIHLKRGRGRHREQYQRWVEEWLSGQGLDMTRFRAALASSAVEQDVERARRMTIAYQVAGTPTLAIDGRYLVDAGSGDQRQMLAITTYLLDKAHAGARSLR